MPDYIIREAVPDDAVQLIDYVRNIADEPNNGIALRSSAEFTMTEDEERELLVNYAAHPMRLYLVAVADDEIIGTCNCRQAGERGFVHTLSLGITVRRDWRDRGVGTALMRRLIDWCRANPDVHRLELTVFTNNPRAIHVYEKLGFVREGVRRAVYEKHGVFLDMMYMGMLFERTMDEDGG